MNQTAAQQVGDPSIQTSGNRKEPSLVSKLHGIKLPNRVLPKCREPVLPYVVKKNDFVLSLSLFWFFYKQATVQIGQLLLATFSINRFPKF